MKELTSLYLPTKDNAMQSTCCKSKIRLDTLIKLEILRNFSHEFFDIKDLFKMKNLRVLKVHDCRSLENLENIANYARSSSKLQHVSITTSCDFSRNVEKGLVVLQQLMFGKNIHFLIINGPMWKFPTYEPNMSSNIVSLDIVGSGLDVEEICRTVERLPLLHDLVIDGVKGKERCFHAKSFPKLQWLWLQNFSDLEKLVVEQGAMPILRSLTMTQCFRLKEIPDGLRFITTLERLRIQEMSPEFKEGIRTPNGEAGKDFHKIRHAPFVRFDGEILS